MVKFVSNLIDEHRLLMPLGNVRDQPVISLSRVFVHCLEGSFPLESNASSFLNFVMQIAGWFSHGRNTIMAPNMVKKLTTTSKKTSGEAMGLMVLLEMRSLQEKPLKSRIAKDIV